MHQLLRCLMPTKPVGIFLLISLCTVGAWRYTVIRRERVADLPLEDLVARLNEQGPPVRLVPTMRNGPPQQGAFLTTTDQAWERLNHLPTAPEWIADWRGTVYCYRLTDPQTIDPRLLLWGDCGQQTGSYILFGDPALRARIAAAVQGRPVPPPAATVPRLIPNVAAE
jgi:hypothetical protein